VVHTFGLAERPYRENLPLTVSTDENCARQLAKTLGYLPLALDQAGAYIAARSTLEKYSRIFEKQFARISKEKPTVWSYDKTVFTTWTISLDAIRSEKPKSVELFILFSFFSNEDISEEMLRRGLGLEEDGKDFAVRPFDRSIQY